MATITVTNRLETGHCSRTKLADVRLDDNVSSLRAQIIHSANLTSNTFDIIYCGQRLKDDASLESYGLHSGSMVHLLPRTDVEAEQQTEKKSSQEIKPVIKMLQVAWKNPAYKSTVESLVTTPDKLHDIVNAVPGLNANPATLSLFMDPDLLKVLVHPGNIRRVLEAHPCFADVAKLISERVTEASKSGQFTPPSSGSYSLDQLSDDDEDAEGGAGGGAAITANQLAAALAAATGGTPVIPSTSAQGGAGRPSVNNLITQDFFQQAIMEAQNSTLTSQLQQMREMGITDETVARQALQATNGDLQAALDLLLEGGISP